jgi:G3E family GTPase
MTEIYIISGFLGAGKTTFIQKILREAFCGDKIALIENDFGDISVDATLLRPGGIEVKEINSGCICCSLSGDFVKALKELLDRFQPEKIIIEPSGVGKLSDIEKACIDPRIQARAEIQTKITVVDVKRCKMYLENFGEFFEDQIRQADVVLLSRTEQHPEKVQVAKELVKGINSHCAIVTKPWVKVSVDEVLEIMHATHTGTRSHACHCGYQHDHESQCLHHNLNHKSECKNHQHSAEEAFDTVTIRLNRALDGEDLRRLIVRMELDVTGTVLRAKGIVRGKKGYLNLQYVPGDIQITPCDIQGDALCIIGRDLNQQELLHIFHGAFV